MTHRMLLVAMVLGMTTAHATAARQPQVYLFGTPSDDFLLLEPGLVRPVSTAGVVGNRSRAASELERELASFASEAPQTSRFSILENVSIPSWMRSSSSISATSFVPLSPRPTFTMNCGRAEYSPHPALNPVQEMRRHRYFAQIAAAACGIGVPIELFDALIDRPPPSGPGCLLV